MVCRGIKGEFDFSSVRFQNSVLIPALHTYSRKYFCLCLTFYSKVPILLLLAKTAGVATLPKSIHK